MDFLITRGKEEGRELYPVMIRVFLYIAESNKNGIYPIQRDIENGLGLIQTSVYRAINALGRGTGKKPDSGMGFIQLEKGTDDWRKKPISLTPAGQKFLESLTQTIKGAGGD